MFSPAIRITLIVAAIIIGSYGLSIGSSSGWIMILAAVGFAFGYFRYGAVWSAWRAIRAENFDWAKSLMSTVRYPSLLSRQTLAYYHFANGLLCMQDDRLDAATDHLLAASEGALRTSNDRCIVLLNLAWLKANAGEIESARNYLKTAGTLPHKQEVANEFSRIESLIEETGENRGEKR